MNSLIILTILSIVIQFCVERLKVLLPASATKEIVPMIALAIGILLSYATDTGLFHALGVMIRPAYIDYIITGIAFSGGSVAFNELIKLVYETRPSNKTME